MGIGFQRRLDFVAYVLGAEVQALLCDRLLLGHCGRRVVPQKISIQEGFELLLKRNHIFSLAFPDNQSCPVLSMKCHHTFLVPLHVAVSLGFPEACICLWPDLTIPAIVHVPEAAVDKNNLAATAENHVRCAWQPLVVESVPIAH